MMLAEKMAAIDCSDPLWDEFYAAFVGGRHGLVQMSVQKPHLCPIRHIGCGKGFALSHHTCGLNGFICIGCIIKEYKLWRARMTEHDGLEEWFRGVVNNG
jgi:hypothetical protein